MEYTKLKNWYGSLVVDESGELSAVFKNTSLEFKFPRFEGLTFIFLGNGEILAKFSIDGEDKRVTAKSEEGLEESLTSIYKESFGVHILINWDTLYPIKGDLSILGSKFLIEMDDIHESDNFLLCDDEGGEKLMRCGEYTKLTISSIDKKTKKKNMVYCYSYFDSKKDALIALEGMIKTWDVI